MELQMGCIILQYTRSYCRIWFLLPNFFDIHFAEEIECYTEIIAFFHSRKLFLCSCEGTLPDGSFTKGLSKWDHAQTQSIMEWEDGWEPRKHQWFSQTVGCIL